MMIHYFINRALSKIIVEKEGFKKKTVILNLTNLAVQRGLLNGVE